MTYSIAGTGNMAWFLATRLNEAGWSCAGIYGRDTAAAAALAAHCGSSVLDSLQEVPDKEGHVCLLAVTDNAIAALAAGLHLHHAVLMHTSGTSSIDLLRGVAVHCAVFWPVYSIVRGQEPAAGILPVVWEANSGIAAKGIKALIGVLAAYAFEADGPQRKQLHLAAVFVNNFINHLAAIGQEICAVQALPFDLLRPLLQQTCERVLEQPAAGVQTGPARRGDTATMQRHLELLSAVPEWNAIYRDMSASIIKMYGLAKDQ